MHADTNGFKPSLAKLNLFLPKYIRSVVDSEWGRLSLNEVIAPPKFLRLKKGNGSKRFPCARKKRAYGLSMRYLRYLILFIGILIFAFIGFIAYLGLMTVIKGFAYDYWIDGTTAILFIVGFSFIGYKLTNKINIGRF